MYLVAEVARIGAVVGPVRGGSLDPGGGLSRAHDPQGIVGLLGSGLLFSYLLLRRAGDLFQGLAVEGLELLLVLGEGDLVRGPGVSPDHVPVASHLFLAQNASMLRSVDGDDLVEIVVDLVHTFHVTPSGVHGH